MADLKSQQELYDDFIVELQSQAPELTDLEIGSIIDLLGGVTSVGVSEVTRTIIDRIARTYFDTAEGPDATGGPDDLQKLAVDHFGAAFARPGSTKAVATVTFSRPSASPGNVTIPAGTVVKTPQNAAGKSTRFETLAEVVLTGLSINASARAVIGGSDGNVLSGKLTQVETTLTDSSVLVTNALAATGGAEGQNDSQYRETIRRLIEALSGSTTKAIKAKAKTVPGVVYAECIEEIMVVKEWSIGGNVPIGDYFRLPRPKLYIADVNGNASGALLEAVAVAINQTRAAGVRVAIIGAVPLAVNWNASISLNPAGPNFTLLSTDPSMVTDEMTLYLQALPIGADFDRGIARQMILAKFGPTGTNDLTDFVTNSPSGTVVIPENQKAIPGTVAVV